VLRAAPEPVLWLEMGLQSAHDVTLRRIHRGHDAAAFARACNQAHVHGFAVCAHVMAGLPGETMQQWRKTLAFLNDLPITGVKFHNLLIVRGSILEGLWRRGSVALLSRAETIQWIVEGVAALRPDIIIHRLTADPAPGELIAPGFAADKRGLHAAIHLALREQRIHQGCRLPANTQELP
jgi:radical SAM protein (TIGR01212 family)